MPCRESTFLPQIIFSSAMILADSIAKNHRPKREKKDPLAAAANVEEAAAPAAVVEKEVPAAAAVEEVKIEEAKSGLVR